MKKIILLFTLTLISSGTMQSMETEQDTQGAYRRAGMNLILAIQMMDIEQIKELINNDADVNFCETDCSVFGYRATPLRTALHKSPEIVELLLDAGANPYFEHPFDGTPLNYVQQEIIPFREQQQKRLNEQLRVYEQKIEYTKKEIERFSLERAKKIEALLKAAMQK